MASPASEDQGFLLSIASWLCNSSSLRLRSSIDVSLAGAGPHDTEGGWDATLAKLYNVMGIPQAYLLDQAGRIHAKGLRGHELDHAIEALLEAGAPAT